MAAIFFVGSRQYEESTEAVIHRSLKLSYKSFGFQVSELFLLTFCHQKPKLPMAAKFSPDPYKMITFCAGHIICMNEQIIWSYIFRGEDFLKFQPMRIKNCEW
jgi:hypothetical protein